MASSSSQPRVWSLWIYDRHCSLLFHADWSTFHNRNQLAGTSSFGNAPSASTANTGGPSTLSLSEQSKLVYGVVFSLRNMTRKFSPVESNSSSSINGALPTAPAGGKETFHSFSTSTYTLSHLQTPTNYTFILMTDPVAPPTRRAPPSTSQSAAPASNTSTPYLLSFSSASSFSGGGGIPSTGGMTTSGVLSQIARGPWIEFVARNAACLALQRHEDDDDDGDLYSNGKDDLEDIEELKEQRRKNREKELQKQRMTGLGKSIDSEAFKAAVERVLAQNKLNAPRM